MFSRGIADGLVLEVVAHPLRRLLQLAQVSDSGLLELCLASCRGASRHAVLEVGIQALIRIQFRTVAGQIDHLDVLGCSRSVRPATSSPCVHDAP